MAKARAARDYKTTCFWLGKETPIKANGSEIRLHIHWHPKTGHDYDQDNAIASLKAGLDGLAMAWGVNDSLFKLTFEKMPPVKGGRVTIVQVPHGEL